jgi:hypothetical protein
MAGKDKDKILKKIEQLLGMLEFDEDQVDDVMCNINDILEGESSDDDSDNELEHEMLSSVIAPPPIKKKTAPSIDAPPQISVPKPATASASEGKIALKKPIAVQPPSQTQSGAGSRPSTAPASASVSVPQSSSDGKSVMTSVMPSGSSKLSTAKVLECIPIGGGKQTLVNQFVQYCSVKGLNSDATRSKISAALKARTLIKDGHLYIEGNRQTPEIIKAMK